MEMRTHGNMIGIVSGVFVIFFTLCGARSQAQSVIKTRIDPALAKDWMNRWQANILSEAKTRYCDTEMGEELGWLVSPFLNGFYYGYMASGDTQWIDHLVDWSDSWIKRGVKEPDGFTGWPKADGASTDVVPNLFTDNMLGEAMALRPAVLMANVILHNHALKARYGAKAKEYLQLSEQVYKKWDERCCWRAVKNGGVWVVPEFGIDQSTHNWTDGYARRKTDGFTLPDNKQNAIAMWLISMYDATKKPVYRERAEQWWSVMKSRIKTRDSGKYDVWDYWDPAGPWDYKSDGAPRLWVGVHPNGGYYGVDIQSIVCAYEHGLVFTRSDIDKLIATNRDFMWNHQVQDAKFQRIDGGEPDSRWAKTPGVLWDALIPYDSTLRKIFEANFNPASWGGLSATPWYIAEFSGRLKLTL
jgi:hypothetical protein